MKNKKNGFSLIEIMLFLSVIVGLLAGAFMLFQNVSEERKSNQLISEWKSIHHQTDQLITNLGNIKVNVFGTIPYNNYIADNIATSYVRDKPDWSAFKTGFGLLEIQADTAPVSAPGPGESPFDVVSPFQGYTISLNYSSVSQKSCIKIAKSIMKLDYMADMIIGDESIYHYLDGEENLTGKELDNKIISSCKKND